MLSRSVFTSVTIWVNLLMLVADILNGTYGLIPIDPELRVILIAVVNVAIRVLRGTPLHVFPPPPPTDYIDPFRHR